MKLTCQPKLGKRDDAELIVLPFWEGPVEAAEFASLKSEIESVISTKDFKGKASDQILIYEKNRILLLGLGKKEAVTAEVLRRAYAAATKIAASKKMASMHLFFPKVPKMESKDVLRAVADGVLLTNYAFTSLKGHSLKDNPVVLLDRVILVGHSFPDSLLKKQCAIAEGVHFVRDLVMGNADDVTPRMLAETAKSIEPKAAGLHANILDRSQIEKEKMGLLLAVNRGSALDPYLITLSYRGNPKSKEHVVLIGKGLTYDTGGLALKPADGMVTMKTDMAGAATVLSTVQTAAALKLKVNVTAVIPTTENAIDAKSYKNGDVYRSMSGKTVEVVNTDAEGRLILADALSYSLAHLKPTAMIDLATLTGGILVALGEDVAGLFTDDQRLHFDLMDASAATGEPLWRLPLYADYTELLKSDIADITNCAAGRAASSVTAALFLKEFSGSVPWAHIDIAGCAYLSKPKHYSPAKATGYGVRLLLEFLERRFA